jgi:MarR-like DNA-binding transcriptional regulator SgrR of sgrS sRNA
VLVRHKERERERERESDEGVFLLGCQMKKDKMKEPLIQKYITQSLSKLQNFLHFHSPEPILEHEIVLI